jgi:mannitol/fructose-specific phosphotransferase system IIA component (Ntr-type)
MQEPIKAVAKGFARLARSYQECLQRLAEVYQDPEAQQALASAEYTELTNALAQIEKELLDARMD